MTLEIRRATAEDVAQIARIHVEGWQQGYRGIVEDAYLDALSIEQKTTQWQEWINAEGNVVLVAKQAGDNALAGFLSFGPVRTRFPGDKGVIASVPGEVYALYVSPDAWRQGVGTQLLATVPDICREKRYGAFGLWALSKNARATNFYERLGGVRSGKKDIQVGTQNLQDTAFVWRDLRKLAGFQIK